MVHFGIQCRVRVQLEPSMAGRKHNVTSLPPSLPSRGGKLAYHAINPTLDRGRQSTCGIHLPAGMGLLRFGSC